MDFTLPRELDDYRRRVRGFVEEHILPLERDPANADEHENLREAVLDPVRARVKAEGLWALQMPKSRGGQGLPVVGMAACYEEMNRSIYGPVCFNSAAPDDGNMMVLEKVATEAQKERWLQPIIDGRVRSSFAMTEPMPGSGSDPAAMLTTATRNGDRWTIDGHKWFITGAEAARHFILIAKTSDDGGGASRHSCSIRTSPASRSSGASRSWGRRNMAGIAKSASTGWRYPTRIV